MSPYKGSTRGLQPRDATATKPKAIYQLPNYVSKNMNWCQLRHPATLCPERDIWFIQIALSLKLKFSQRLIKWFKLGVCTEFFYIVYFKIYFKIYFKTKNES